MGQVMVVGGNATTAVPGAPVSVAYSPLISTPDIALPGSGNAVGAPLSSAAENDSRTSLGPSVFNPNGAALVHVNGYPTAESELRSPVDVEGSTLSTPPFENGIQHFVSGLSGFSERRQSLAEIALLYRRRQDKVSRSFNNDSIAELNARGVRTGNLGPETSTATHSSSPGIGERVLVAQNEATALPQSDREPLPSGSGSNKPSRSVASQQRHPSADDTAATPVAGNKPISDEISAPGKTVEKAGSPLPLLILVLGLAVSGTLYWLKK
jgi:hypothetical protein